MAHSGTVDFGTYAIVAALLAGSVRALLLWRASIGVDVVNVMVLQTLAEGRGASLDQLLRGSGSGLYLDVAGAIGRAALDLGTGGGEETDARKQLQHAGRVAIQSAGRHLRRSAWLNILALTGIGYAGIDAVTRASATPFKAVALLTATLLWLANLRSASHIATRIYAGASSLIDDLLASLDQVEGFAARK
jgi:hypothetical protein